MLQSYRSISSRANQIMPINNPNAPVGNYMLKNDTLSGGIVNSRQSMEIPFSLLSFRGYCLPLRRLSKTQAMIQTFVLDPILRRMLRTIGADIDGALAEIGVNGDDNESLHLSEREYSRFMELIRKSMPGDDCVIRLVNMENVEYFSPPSFAAICSRDGLEFLERFIKYKRLVCPLEFILIENADSVIIQIKTASADRLPPFLAELEVAYIVALLRKATGRHIIPLEVAFTHDVLSGALPEFMGRRLEHSSITRLTLSKHDLAISFRTYNSTMWNCLRPGLEQQLLESAGHDSFLKEVRTEICRQISGGSSTLESTATALCMSVRSFQRKLSGYGVHFSQLLSGARHELAVTYLSNPQLTVSDIAYLLGFKETNSFLRAFRKWEGRGVAEYRRGLRKKG